MSEIEKLYALRWEVGFEDTIEAGGICVTDGPDEDDDLTALMWVEMEPEEMEELAIQLLVTASKMKKTR